MPSEGYAPKSPDLSSFYSTPAQQDQVPPYQQYAYQQHQQHLQPPQQQQQQHQEHHQYQPQQGFYQPPPQHQQQAPHNLSYLQSPPQQHAQPPPQHQGQPEQQPYYNAPGSGGGGVYQPEHQHQQPHYQQQPLPRYGGQPPLPQHQHQQPQYQGYGGASQYQQPGQQPQQYGSSLGYQQPSFPAEPYQSASLQPQHQYGQAHVTQQPYQHQLPPQHHQHQQQQELELKLEESDIASPNSMPPRRSAAAAAAAAIAADASSSVSPGPQSAPLAPLAPASLAPPTHLAPAAEPRNIIVDSPVKTRFPTARIKRIMQADEEVGKVSQQTPIAVGKALELFMVNLVSKSADIARAKNSKRVTAQMLKQVVESDDQWDFLRDIVKKIDPDEKHGRGPRNSTGGAGTSGEGGVGGGTRMKLESDSGGDEQPKKRGRPGRKKKA